MADDKNKCTDEARRRMVQELRDEIAGMSPEYKGTPNGMRAVLDFMKEISKLEGLYSKDRQEPDDTAPPVYDRVPMIIIENPNKAGQ